MDQRYKKDSRKLNQYSTKNGKVEKVREDLCAVGKRWLIYIYNQLNSIYIMSVASQLAVKPEGSYSHKITDSGNSCLSNK